MAGQTLHFGPFRLDPAGVVSRDGRPVPVGRRGVLLLRMLLRHHGQVVTKDALIDAAWPNEAVEESNLSVQIAQLRKQLGADRIRTVERVGYQLLDEAGQPRELTPSLMILPFRHFGGAEGISEVLTDDLKTALARFGSLRIPAPGVHHPSSDYALEGAVRSEDGNVRITLRLVERRSGHYCWADFLEISEAQRLPIDLLASMIEDQVELAEIARVSREQPKSEESADLFRRAQLHIRMSLPGDYGAALVLLEGALAQEPDNMRYLSSLCEVIGSGISMGWPEFGTVEADRMFAYATRGLRQPAYDADALALFGFGIFRSGDPEGGYRLMRRAADLNPASVSAVKLAGQAALNWGSLADSESYFRKALSLAPQHLSQGGVMAGLSRIRMAQGQFADALEWAKRANRITRNFGGAHWTLIAANAMLGHDEEARLCLARYRLGHAGVTIERIRLGQPPRARLSSTLEGLDRAGMR